MINIEIRQVIKDFTYSYTIKDESGNAVGYSSPANKSITLKCLNQVMNNMGYDEITEEEFDEAAA